MWVIYRKRRIVIVHTISVNLMSIFLRLSQYVHDMTSIPYQRYATPRHALQQQCC